MILLIDSELLLIDGSYAVDWAPKGLLKENERS